MAVEVVDLNSFRSVEELANHQKEVRASMTKLNTDYAGIPFPSEAREDFATLTERDRELTARIKELEERKRIVGEIARNSANGTENEARTLSPYQINKMPDRDIWDLSGIRASVTDPGEANQELRDRAMRAVELAHPAHPNAERTWFQSHMANLLDNVDSADKEIARRVLLTGNPAYQRAFAKILSGRPVLSLTAEEQRAVERAGSVGTGSAGGFAIVYTLDPTLIPIGNWAVNPYRAISNVTTIAGTNEWRGVTTTAITAAYAAEGTEASDNMPTLAQPALVTQRAQAFVPVSIELTQDLPALQGELAKVIQDAKDELEATQFTTGVGTTVFPQGVITGATGITTAGGVASFAVADLYALEAALGPRFRPRATVVMNRAIANRIRQFDTGGGASMWLGYPNPLQGGLQNQPFRGPQQGSYNKEVIGYPAYEASAMASVLTTGSDIAVIGDFADYYKIVDRVGMDIEVIPHLFGATNRFPTGQRGIYAMWRNTARVLDPAGFRKLRTG
jgi:HK97 family phage major capsid protein